MSQKIKMYDVHSSSVAKLGWYKDETTGTEIAVVEFKKGIRYMYFPITNEKFSEVFQSDEKGKWVREHLINNKSITCVKIGQPKLDLK